MQTMTTAIIPYVDLVNNTQQRLACVLVLDGSHSMLGEAINNLNEGLKIFEHEIKADDVASQRVQVLVLRAGDDGKVEVISDWTDALEFQAPTIRANGNTPLGLAMRTALDMVEQRKRDYDAHGIAYNRPWIFLISDGEPTDRGWESAAEECIKAQELNRCVIFTLGTATANAAKLKRFSHRYWKLDHAEFKEMFMWLSRSASVGSRAKLGEKTQLAEINFGSPV
jgi:uncharacterized protein YegL